MKWLLGILGVLAAASSVSTATASEAALRAVSFQPDTVVFAKYFYRWVRATNDRCKGRIAITVSGPEKIASHLQWHALKTGRVDMYFGPANYYRGALAQGDVFNLAKNGPADQRRNGAWFILNSLHNKGVNAWYLTTLLAGVKFYVYTTRPAKDRRFDGFRFRSTPLYELYLRSLGAETQYLPASAMRGALQSSAIDGYVWPMWSGGMGWERYAKYRYGPGFLDAAAPILVNFDRWLALTDAQRKCLTDMAVWVEREWPKWREGENAIQRAALDRAGIKYQELGPDFGRKAEEIYWKLLRTAEPEFVRVIRPLLEGKK